MFIFHSSLQSIKRCINLYNFFEKITSNLRNSAETKCAKVNEHFLNLYFLGRDVIQKKKSLIKMLFDTSTRLYSLLAERIKASYLQRKKA